MSRRALRVDAHRPDISVFVELNEVDKLEPVLFLA